MIPHNCLVSWKRIDPRQAEGEDGWQVPTILVPRDAEVKLGGHPVPSAFRSRDARVRYCSRPSGIFASEGPAIRQPPWLGDLRDLSPDEPGDSQGLALVRDGREHGVGHCSRYFGELPRVLRWTVARVTRLDFRHRGGHLLAVPSLQ